MRQRILAALVCTTIGVGGVSLSACGQRKKGAPVATSASARPPSLPANVDADLLKQLADIAQACKVDAVAGNLTCPQGENRRLISEFVASQRSRPAAVGTLAHALADSNPSVQVVTAHLLNGAFRSPWGPDIKVGAVPAPQAQALLAAALKAPKALARQALPAAVLAATLAGQREDLYAALDRADQTELRPLGYRYIMTHGRLDVFGKIQQLVKDNNSALSFAALEAPQNMYAWTQTEKAAICPWAAELLKDPRPNVATRAAGLLSSCGGEFVDALLERGEKALKAGQFNAGELSAFRDLCSAANLREAGGATQKQCERNRDLLDTVVTTKKLDSQTRSVALASLAYQWPDDKTLKRAQSLLKDPDKSLAQHADRTIKRLEQRKQVESGSPAPDKNSASKPGKPALPH